MFKLFKKKTVPNLWILTEERPKKEVLKTILLKFVQDNGISGFIDNLRVLPVLEKGKFTFTYELVGFRCNKVNKVFIKTVSGSSSFVDFLVFYQAKEPDPTTDKPDYAIEETKTDDQESRNTGVYQRCSKFVYINSFFPRTRKIMLYNLQIGQKERPTETNIFGTRMLLTIGVEILGKKLDGKIFKPFSSIEELIASKESMRKAPSGNVPIEIKREGNIIFVSGRLVKSDRLAHDPNIGALSAISDTLRKLGWKGEIVMTRHGLGQKHLESNNKFILIASQIGIKLDGLTMPKAKPHAQYWRYDTEGEKIGTIFIHLVVESFTEAYSIYENHAGSERGYFVTSSGECVTVDKYTDRVAYKSGEKDKIINLPDLTILDVSRKEIVNIEGEMYKNRLKGIEQISLFDAFENLYIKKQYPGLHVVRTVVLYGGHSEAEMLAIEIEIGFILSRDGDLVLGVKAPGIFKDAIERLLDFWG
ncbi:hypothetical protein FWC63_03105 [Candidatus Saccharibacteria bacterium]|nr:hypothetical protein [Candidatus Saccharibacteria bacterium]